MLTWVLPQPWVRLREMTKSSSGLVRVLTVQEMSTRAFSPQCLHPEDCSLAATTCTYLLVQPNATILPSCLIMCNEHAEFPGPCGSSIRVRIAHPVAAFASLPLMRVPGPKPCKNEVLCRGGILNFDSHTSKS